VPQEQRKQKHETCGGNTRGEINVKGFQGIQFEEKKPPAKVFSKKNRGAMQQ